MKQHLAAIRVRFDWMVFGHVLHVNPAGSVRKPKHVVKKGKTPVLAGEQARLLLDLIDTDSLVGLRGRALVALMTYSFARRICPQDAGSGLFRLGQARSCLSP